jgi:hypothetical protein
MTEKYLLERDIGDGERLVAERRRWSRERERVKLGKTKKKVKNEPEWRKKKVSILFMTAKLGCVTLELRRSV